MRPFLLADFSQIDIIWSTGAGKVAQLRIGLAGVWADSVANVVEHYEVIK